MAFRWSTGIVNRRNGYPVNKTQNGDFETDPNVEWTPSGAVISSVSSPAGKIGNCLKIANSGVSAGKCFQDHVTIAGRIYRLKGYFQKGSAASGKILVGTTTVENAIYESGDYTDATWAEKLRNITALDAATRLTLQSNGTVAAETGFFDEFSFVDISALMVDILANCKCNVYSGTQPPSADDAATGTLGVTVTNDSSATGLTFEAAAGGQIIKPSTELWNGPILSLITAGWFRFYEDGDDPSLASTTAARIDGAVGSEMILGYPDLIVGGPPFSISSFTLTIPLS